MAGRTQNLKPWQKGQSGNPEGRKPGETYRGFTSALVAMLEAQTNEGGPTYAEAIVEKIIKLCKEGDPNALKLVGTILDRVEGKVADKQVIESTQVVMVVPWEPHRADPFAVTQQ